jgi:hypothetical protein
MGAPAAMVVLSPATRGGGTKEIWAAAPPKAKVTVIEASAERPAGMPCTDMPMPV